jgi:Flp pilus assembly protein TadD
MGRLDDALVELREAVRLDPGYGKAHRNLGIVLAQRGQFAEAVPEFAEALRADPGDAEVRSYLERARALSRPQR